MKIVDYEYYRNTYEGTLTESEFNQKNKEAQALVSQVTMRRIENLDDNQLKLLERVKYAICSLVDKMVEIDKDEAKNSIASETVGPHSISFANKKRRTEEQKFFEYNRAISLYLSGTGLLYRGLGC